MGFDFRNLVPALSGWVLRVDECNDGRAICVELSKELSCLN